MATNNYYAYAYYGSDTTLKEFIRDKSLRNGNNGVNSIALYWEDEPTLTSISWRLKKVGGSVAENEQTIEATTTKMLFPSFKDIDTTYFEQGQIYAFHILPIGEITQGDGSYEVQITGHYNPDNAIEDEETIKLGLMTIYIENGVITEDLGVSQSQFDYLLNQVATATAGNALPITGGTMQGDIDMNAKSLINVNKVAFAPSIDLGTIAELKTEIDGENAYLKLYSKNVNASSLACQMNWLTDGGIEFYKSISANNGITNLPTPTNDSDAVNKEYVDDNFATKTYVNEKLSSVYTYKGSVASYSKLPTSGLTVGDVYNVEDTGMNYAWTGSKWDALGSTIDTSAFVLKSGDTMSGNLKVDEIDNTNGNALVRYKSTESKNVFGGSNYDCVLMGNSTRPYYSNSGSDFSGNELALKSDIDTKQDTLVSGTNIKTINNQSLLGSGNISISGGATIYYSHTIRFVGTLNSANCNFTIYAISTSNTQITSVAQLISSFQAKTLSAIGWGNLDGSSSCIVYSLIVGTSAALSYVQGYYITTGATTQARLAAINFSSIVDTINEIS